MRPLRRQVGSTGVLFGRALWMREALHRWKLTFPAILPWLCFHGNWKPMSVHKRISILWIVKAECWLVSSSFCQFCIFLFSSWRNRVVWRLILSFASAIKWALWRHRDHSGRLSMMRRLGSSKSDLSLSFWEIRIYNITHSNRELTYEDKNTEFASES